MLNPEIADECGKCVLHVINVNAKSRGRKDTYIECLGGAGCECAVARRLVVPTQNEDWPIAKPAGSDEADLKKLLLSRLLWLAAVASLVPAGNQRMRSAAERVCQVAILLQTQMSLAQLLWRHSDFKPMPPGLPVIDLYQGETAQ